MDNERHELAVIQKNQRENISIALQLYRGSVGIDIRVAFNGKLTRKGIFLSPAILRQVVDLLPGILQQLEANIAEAERLEAEAATATRH